MRPAANKCLESHTDARLCLLQTADGIGRLTVASFDATFNKPNVITRFLENGTPINTTMQYDTLTGNLLSSTNPENNTSRYTYNTRGQVLEATNPETSGSDWIDFYLGR